jgi:phospholipid/cholesterol/gamma-HCH transport system permease protein
MIGRYLARMGEGLRSAVMRLGGIFLLFVDAVGEMFTPPYRLRPVLKEVHEIGAKSLGVVAVLGLFTVMALALQTGLTLKRFRGELYVGPLVALAMLRELGPVLCGFMVAARAGSGIAAEIGSMRVTEQLDAMRACGANPTRELVMPKVIASAFVLPLLTVVGNVAGILGGLIMAIGLLGMDAKYYLYSIPRTVTLADYTSGLIKTIFFGMIIASVSCYEGFHATYGSLGVSRAATRSVVATFILILLADVLLIAFFVAHGGIYWH